MEIAPIAGIRIMPMPKVSPANPGLSGVFDIELSRAQEDSYSGNNKSTGGQDDEAEEQDDMLDDEMEQKLRRIDGTGNINIFA